MEKTLLYIFFTILCVNCHVNALELIDGKIKISVVTTSACFDTIRFIQDQLVPAYWEYKDFLEVEFIPWGRTSYLQDGSMQCQFGPNDCWANRVHRCALSLLEDQDSRVRYMNCEFTSPFPAYTQKSYACANTVGIDLADLDECVTTTGQVLDDAAQAAAELPMKYLNFVPAIVFNNIVDDVQALNQARRELRSMICLALADDPSTGVISCTNY